MNDLRLQIRELTNANLDLRAQLKEQSGTIEKLQAEHERLCNEIKREPRSLPPKRNPSRKQTAPQ